MAYALLAIAIFLNVAGQLLLKRAAMVGGSSQAEGAALQSFLSPWFFGGCGSLGASMLLWVIVLRRLPLTLAHPMTGVVYILVPVVSHVLWNEPLPAIRVAGISVIIFGVYLVARGS